MTTTSAFEEGYKGLNKAQKQAVDAIDGPVMVVAGPGTGKTQVLTLRIANILQKTDTPASGILCLTFTNAGVHAMRERLLRLIGSRGSEVYISTFHRFAIGLIEKYYPFIDFEAAPTLLGDTESVALVDEILETGEWQYLRPRSDSAKYFSDLKSLISLLKRENITPEEFLANIEADVINKQNNPDNISSRGARKGELKAEILKEIESLNRTREVVKFYREYEGLKHKRLLMDYDDVLRFGLEIVRFSDDARATIRENYLYVLVDEHQDSSGVQNAFLEAIWGDTEQPNIFVVGDDRQLIYGFGGASIEHFTKFRSAFGKAQEITLVENYRSTQVILDAAEALLTSDLATGKLHSNSNTQESNISIFECDYPRDEIIFAGQSIKELIAAGTDPSEIAVLVPKNHQVRTAVHDLRNQGIPVAVSGTVSFFAAPETRTIRHIMSALIDPYDGRALGELLLDPALGIPPLEAHRFLRATNTRKLSIDDLLNRSKTLLALDPIAELGTRLKDWLACSQTTGLYGLVQKIGEELFFADPKDHEHLMRQIEVVRTFIHLIESQTERDAHLTLGVFLAHLDRLESYGHEIPLAVFSADKGVRVLTLHGSKGLEWKHVYIAHLDDASLMKGKRQGFTLPEDIQSLIEEKNELAARRELYVAITRAKERCSLLYARHSYTGADLVPLRILADLPDALVERESLGETEGAILAHDPKTYVASQNKNAATDLAELVDIVANEYADAKVSVTLLNNFFECTWKWYFRNLLQLPESKTESLVLGSAVHTGIEYILKHREEGSDEELQETLVECIEKEYVFDASMQTRVLREANAILKNFRITYLPHISLGALSERSISYRDPKMAHLSLYGKIDLSEYAGEGSVSVTDFKTGSTKSKSTVEKRDDEGRMSSLLRQLAMYSYLIQGVEKGTEVSTCKLLFIEAKPGDKDASYITSISNEELADLKKDISDYDELVRSGKWIERPCSAKLYGRNEECEYCAKARRLYGFSRPENMV